MFKHSPPDLALSTLNEILGILGVGILNPANQADGTEKMKAEEIAYAATTWFPSRRTAGT